MTKTEIRDNQLLRNRMFSNVLSNYSNKISIISNHFSCIYFASNVIRNKVGLFGNGYGNWTGIEDLIVYQIAIRGSYSTIALIVGPSDNEKLRRKWLESCKENTDIFKVGKRPAEHWKGIYSSKFYIEGDSIASACEKLDNFLKTTFDKIDDFFLSHSVN